MAKKKSPSLQKSKPEIKPSETPLRILALKRPSPPPVIEKPVDDQVISPAGDKAGDKPVQESVVSSEPVTQNTVITTPLVNVDLSKHIDNHLAVDSGTKLNNDPLIGTFIVVTAPWGQKVSVEIVDTYIAPSGAKWVCFNGLDEIPEGWTWLGGVKLISA